MDQPGKVANPARGQLNRENNIYKYYCCVPNSGPHAACLLHTKCCTVLQGLFSGEGELAIPRHTRASNIPPEVSHENYYLVSGSLHLTHGE